MIPTLTVFFQNEFSTQGMVVVQMMDSLHRLGDPEKMGIHRNPSGNNHVMLTWLVVEPTYLKNMLVKMGIFPK